MVPVHVLEQFYWYPKFEKKCGIGALGAIPISKALSSSGDLLFVLCVLVPEEHGRLPVQRRRVANGSFRGQGLHGPRRVVRTCTRSPDALKAGEVLHTGV